MIAALLLCLAQATAPAPGTPGTPSTGGSSAVLLADSKSVAVGQPIELVLEVDHALDATVRVPDERLGLDDSWVVLSRDEPRARPTGDGRARTTVRATVASLEPGERDLAALQVEILSRAESFTILATPPHVTVASVLGDEDHERPPHGFRENVELGPEREPWPWLVGLALAIAVGAGVWRGRRSRRRAPAAAAEPSALARLDELERSDLERGELAREAHFELTRVLRSEIDRRAGVRRAALDDDEWLSRALADAGFAERIGPERERL
ncbi:MAG: hypothetical protein IT453_06980, partial [Planctomycetes bacterium]|nr:hypothetical protein [Planctomycetota bacterium]